ATDSLTYPEKTVDSHISYFKPILGHKVNSAPVDTTKQQIFASSDYNEVKNLINFHSLSIDPGNFTDFSAINPGIYWLSDNLLNTAQVRLGYRYDGDTRSSEYLAAASY